MTSNKGKRNKSAINLQQNESTSDEEADDSNSASLFYNSEQESELGSEIESDMESSSSTKEKQIEDSNSNTPKFYQERLNRLSLYIRFPKKLDKNRDNAVSKVKLLNKKIINVRIPRQKYANFCLVDFANIEDKTTAFKELKSIRLEEYKRRLIVKDAIPNVANKLNKSKIRIKEIREAKQLLKNLIINIERNLRKDIAGPNKIKSLTNEIIIQNLPIDASELDIKKIFPDAYDISISIIKNENDNELEAIAYVTLPTPKDAKNAVKGKFRIKNTLIKVLFSKSTFAIDYQHKNKQKKSDKLENTNQMEN